MVEATGIEEAFGVFEAYEYGGDRSLVSLGKMLREVLQKVDLVGDLGYAKVGQYEDWVGTERVCVR